MGPQSSASTALRQVPSELMSYFTRYGRSITIKRGQFMFTAGSPSDEVYLILSGRVQATLISPQGRETILREIGAGHLVGDFAALGATQRTSNVVAREKSRLAFLPASQFNEVVTTSPAIAQWVISRLIDHLRVANDRLYEMATMPVGQRLQCELLRIADDTNTGADSLTIAPAPTHAEFAAQIGANRETVSREFSSMSTVGLITQSGRQITVNSMAQLRKLVTQAASGSRP